MSADGLLYGALFALAAAALLLLPLAPAWHEWRRPSDCAPLPIPEDDADEPMYLSDRLRAHVAASSTHLKGTIYELLQQPDGAPAAATGLPALARLQGGNIRLLAREDAPPSFYAVGDLKVSQGVSLNVVMAEGDLQLGPGSRICHWGHADGFVRLGERSVAACRLSSRQLVRLERGCSFQRVHASMVCFGAPQHVMQEKHRPVLASRLEGLPGGMQRSPGLWRIDGDCSVPGGRSYTGSLVVTGLLSLGEGSWIEGSVKAQRGIVLARGARITGAAVCPQGIHVLADADIGGPVVSEDHVLLRAGACIGTEAAPTTVSAAHIVAEEGARAHGTVWAREAGVVVRAQA